MTALVALLPLLLPGALAQHGPEWTYSGKPPAQGLRFPWDPHHEEGSTPFLRTTGKPGISRGARPPTRDCARGPCRGLPVAGSTEATRNLDLDYGKEKRAVPVPGPDTLQLFCFKSRAARGPG